MTDVSRRATDIREYLPGLKAFTTPSGFRVIKIHYYADKEHTEEWANEERKKYTTRDWRREFELDWSSPSGAAFYPEFADVGKDRFIKRVERLIKGPVFRSYDFGRRRPACAWFQYSPKADRLWLYREFMPHDLQAHEFRDAVRVLSGELEYEAAPERSRRWIDIYSVKPSGAHCPAPWFPPGTKFVDISGKEALQGTSASPTHEEGVVLNIFREGGIYLQLWNGSVEGRHQTLRRLMRVYPDGEPGLWVDPQCEEAIELMAGALSYPKETQAVPVPTNPRDDGHFINLADAITYGVAAVVPVDKPKTPSPDRVIGFNEERQAIMAKDDEDQIPWYETRRS